MYLRHLQVWSLDPVSRFLDVVLFDVWVLHLLNPVSHLWYLFSLIISISAGLPCSLIKFSLQHFWLMFFKLFLADFLSHAAGLMSLSWLPYFPIHPVSFPFEAAFLEAESLSCTSTIPVSPDSLMEELWSLGRIMFVLLFHICVYVSVLQFAYLLYLAISSGCIWASF